MIDFTIPEETKAMRDKVRAFVQSECHPAEEVCTADNFDETLAGLRSKARSQGLWCPFIPTEHGGMGLRPLANALVQMELGESHLGALSLNTQGPDDATMLTLLEHGTDFQKEQYLKPLLNGEKRICYSMTEKAAGADATGMQTTAVLDGDEWVLNGEKWFSSSASVADIAVVMAKTDPDAPRHEQYSTFIVELPNPGYHIVRNIETMQPHTDLGLKLGGSHSEIKIENHKQIINSGCKITSIDEESGLIANKYDEFAKKIIKSIYIEPKIKLNRINDGKTDPAGNLWFGTMDNLERKIERGSLYKLDKNLLLSKIDKNYIDAHVNLSTMLLTVKNFKEGLEEYEWRHKTSKGLSRYRHFPQPKWDGKTCEAEYER